MRTTLPGLLLVPMFFQLFASLAQAAPPTAAPSKSYQVEVVVFENRAAATSDEHWPVSPAIAEDKDAIVPTEGLAPDSKLRANIDALEKDGTYRILAQRSWVQAGEEKVDAKPARIRTANNELDGMLRFYVSRFLHVEVDMALRPVGASTPIAAPAIPGANSSIVAATPAGNPAIHERRRVKSLETHYFDHPRFGVLVRVTPVGAAATSKKSR